LLCSPAIRNVPEHPGDHIKHVHALLFAALL
jgi:hypothetical protein